MKYSPKLLTALPLLAVVFFQPRPAHAAPQTWLGSNGDYKVSSNWSGNVVPGSGTSVVVDSGTANLTSSETGTTGTLAIGVSGTGVITVNGGIFVDTSGVVLGANAGSNGTLNVTNAGTWQPEGPGGSTSVIVGQSGVGVLNFTGGSINVTGGESITLGANAGGSGTFNASSGTMQFTGSGTLNVGGSGTGALVVNGADLQVINANIGQNTTGTGSASVSSGTLAASNTFNIGASGTGVLNVNGGVVSYNASTTTNIGNKAGSVGTVNLSSGTFLLSPNSLNIGVSGSGALVVSGGFVNPFGVILGVNSGGNGSIVMTGGTWGSTSVVNVGQSGTGSLTINGGDFTPGNLTIGGSVGSTGTMNVLSGTAAVGHFTVGQDAAGAATINGGYMSMSDINLDNGILTVNSGTLSMGNDHQASYLGSYSGTLQMNGGLFTSAVGLAVATSGTSNGVVVVSGGTFQMTGSGFVIGQSGVGSLTVNGGYLSTFDGAFGLGGGQASAVVSSGTWASTSIRVLSGSLNLTGSGVITMQSGTGTLFVEGTGIVNIGTGGTAGTLNAGSVAWENSGSGTINFNHTGTVVFTPSVAGQLETQLNKLGAGTTILTGTSLLLGGVNISAGTLQFGNGGASPALYTPALVNNGALVFDTSGTLTPFAIISGTGALLQEGQGVLVLSQKDTYSGSTIVSNSALSLDFSQSTAPLTNIINNTGTNSGLLLAGGALSLTGSSAVTNSQAFNGMVINPGASSITMTQNGATSLSLILGAVTRNTGGLLNIVPGTSGTIATSSSTDLFGLLPGITISGSNWATVKSGTIAALASYTLNSNVATWGANQNIAPNSGAYSGSFSGALTINSLKISGSNTASTIRFGQLTVTDGILQTSAVPLFFPTTFASGTLSGAAGKDLIVINNSAASLAIVSTIVDNTSATGLTIGGTGSGAISVGMNSYTGPTTITQGTLQVGTGTYSGSLGTGAVLNNGTLVFVPGGPSTIGNAISGIGNTMFSDFGPATYAGLDTSTGTTTVNFGSLSVTGTISPSAAMVVSSGGTLAGTGRVGNISGAGRVAPGGASILTASQADPAGGMSLAFHFNGTGAPVYGNSAASKNDVLHLTGATPLASALTSANTIAVDFTGLVLQSGQIYYGGLFTDAAIANAMVQNATFSYTGLGGATVQFAGMTSVASAAFATGTVSNGEVMEFDVTGSPVPAAPPWALLLAGAGLFITLLAMRGRIAG